MREDDLLRHIERSAADLTGLAGRFGRVVVGPGDDCAVIDLGEGNAAGSRLVIGVDQLVQGRHVESGLFDDPGPERVGLVARKAIARAVSDLAAMGARPAWGLATGLLPRGYAHGRALVDAMHEWGRRFGCPLIGGDLASGDRGTPAVLTVTAAGMMDPGSEPVLRRGAQPGDLLWLTGQVGGSLESGWHLRFEPRVAAGLAAARAGPGVVHAMIDLSDGLGIDAGRLGRASGVVVELEAARLPVSHRSPGWRDAIADGEDYELLIAATPERAGEDGRVPPPFHAEPDLLGPIGTVREVEPGGAAGAVIVDAYGTPERVDARGWDHGG